ncbi:MAG: hypothetical protein GY847_39590 [Proteobacteria bacterium]|nr:hypothetical protein [Pseudomonadota bacterium]
MARLPRWQREGAVLSDPAEAVRTGDLCYASSGFSLHAATRIYAGDTDALERLCRYVARPPLAAGSLTQVSEELLSFKLKTPWSNGTTSFAVFINRTDRTLLKSCSELQDFNTDRRDVH